MEKDLEVARIRRRIAKAERRIARGYSAPTGKETEQHRLERLMVRLTDLTKPVGVK